MILDPSGHDQIGAIELHALRRLLRKHWTVLLHQFESLRCGTALHAMAFLDDRPFRGRDQFKPLPCRRPSECQIELHQDERQRFGGRHTRQRVRHPQVVWQQIEMTDRQSVTIGDPLHDLDR